MNDTPSVENYQDAFDRIERAVDGGDTALLRLGFWRLVDRIKIEPALSEHWAEVVGRIDRKAFEGRHRLRFPVWFGTTVLALGAFVSAGLVPAALAVARRSSTPEPLLSGVLVVAAAVGLAAAVHDLAHYVVGRLGGIRFLWYFLDGPLLIQPGIKVDYETYVKASAGSRATMHAAGALASKVAPLAVFAGAYVPHAQAGYDLLPAWSLWTVLGFGLLEIVTDIVWSRKFSDWKKVGRELRVARAQRNAHL
ncbi:MAG TPA: hypothetical protein VGR49_05425 [Actinomycetota bacterium]|jgi:hypothetical protein|nr:hypothetical protein [Actinomycetota bacterium]